MTREIELFIDGLQILLPSTVGKEVESGVSYPHK